MTYIFTERKSRTSVWVLLLAVLLLVWIFWPSPSRAAGMEVHKIVELKQQSGDNLWSFAKKLPSSFEAQIFYGLFISGLLGMVSSWIWKWSKGTADGFRHFTTRYVVGQILWLIGAAIGAIFTVGFTTDSGEFYGWLSVIWSGAFAGFSGEVKTSDAVTSPVGVPAHP